MPFVPLFTCGDYKKVCVVPSSGHGYRAATPVICLYGLSLCYEKSHNVPKYFVYLSFSNEIWTDRRRIYLPNLFRRRFCPHNAVTDTAVPYYPDGRTVLLLTPGTGSI